MPVETLNKIYINRKFNCPPEQLFDWLVQPQLIAQWFGPELLSVGEVETDLRIGGHYSIELQKPNDQSFFIKGEYVEIKKPVLLSFTFIYDGLPSCPPNSIVNIHIEEFANGQSQLTLSQEFMVIPTDMAKRTEAWNTMFEKLNGKFIA